MTAEQVRAWRHKHHLTQAALATLLEVSLLTIKRWEGGYQAPPAYLTLALERLHQILRQQAMHVRRAQLEPPVS